VSEVRESLARHGGGVRIISLRKAELDYATEQARKFQEEREQQAERGREVEEGDALLVLATDGVWEHLTDQEVIDIAAEAGGYRDGTPSSSSFDNAASARAVCAAARVAWTKESAASVDDITAVVAHISHDHTVPPRLASTTRGRAARMSIGAMMKDL
jgi:serine/threonine protein phosphatase PrpC